MAALARLLQGAGAGLRPLRRRAGPRGPRGLRGLQAAAERAGRYGEVGEADLRAFRALLGDQGVVTAPDAVSPVERGGPPRSSRGGGGGPQMQATRGG